MDVHLSPGEAVLPRLTSFVSSMALLHTTDFAGETDGATYKAALEEWNWLAKSLLEDQTNGAFNETSTSSSQEVYTQQAGLYARKLVDRRRALQGLPLTARVTENAPSTSSEAAPAQPRVRPGSTGEPVKQAVLKVDEEIDELEEDDYEPHLAVSTAPAHTPSSHAILAPTPRPLASTVSAATPLPTPAPTPTPPLPVPLPLPRRLILPPSRARQPARLPDMLPQGVQRASSFLPSTTLVPVKRTSTMVSAAGSNASTSAPTRPPSAGPSSSDLHRARVTTSHATKVSEALVSRQELQVGNQQRPTSFPIPAPNSVPNSSSASNQRPAALRSSHPASRPQLPFPSASISLPLPSPAARDPQSLRSEIANSYTTEIKCLTTLNPRPPWPLLLTTAKIRVWSRALSDPSLGWVETDARIAFEIIDTHCANLIQKQQLQHQELQQQQQRGGAEWAQGGGASPRVPPSPSEVAFQRALQAMQAQGPETTAGMGSAATPVRQVGPATSQTSPLASNNGLTHHPAASTSQSPALGSKPYAPVASSAPKPSTSTAAAEPRPDKRRAVSDAPVSGTTSQPVAKRPRGRPPAVPAPLAVRHPIVPVASAAPTPIVSHNATQPFPSVIRGQPVSTDIRNFPPRPSAPTVPIPIIPIAPVAPLPAPRFPPSSSGSLAGLNQAAGIVSSPAEVPRVKKVHKRKTGKYSVAARKMEGDVRVAMKDWLEWYDGRKEVQRRVGGLS